MGKVMNIKKSIYLLLVVLCGAQISAPMEKRNRLTPFAAAAGSYALARYGSDIAANVLPQDSVAGQLVPPLLRYGGYGLAAYCIKNGLNISVADVIKPEQQKKLLKAGLNCVPALACHPAVAGAAAHGGSALAHIYLDPVSAQYIATYLQPALMATGGLGAAYLINRNLCNGQLLTKKTIKKAVKDAKSYSFLAPLAVTYHAQTIKDMAMAYVPEAIGANLKSDMGTCLKNGLYWGGIGAAAYLFATNPLGLATQKYLQKRITKLVNTIKNTCQRITASAAQVEACKQDLARFNGDLHNQATQLATFTKESERRFASITKALRQLENGGLNLENNSNRLEEVTAVAQTQTTALATSTQALLDQLHTLRETFAQQITRLKDGLHADAGQALQELQQKEKEILQKIVTLEQECAAENSDLQKIQISLLELTRLMDLNGQTHTTIKTSVDALHRFPSPENSDESDLESEPEHLD